MEQKLKTVRKVDLGASSGAEGWKKVLQLLKEQNEKMERLARALSVTQQDMLRNNPGFVKDSANDATEVLSGMLNTHKCLLESVVEIQKRLESHHVSKRMGIFRRLRSASLGDNPKKLKKGEKRVAPSPPRIGFPRKGRGLHLPPLLFFFLTKKKKISICIIYIYNIIYIIYNIIRILLISIFLSVGRAQSIGNRKTRARITKQSKVSL